MAFPPPELRAGERHPGQTTPRPLRLPFLFLTKGLTFRARFARGAVILTRSCDGSGRPRAIEGDKREVCPVGADSSDECGFRCCYSRCRGNLERKPQREVKECRGARFRGGRDFRRTLDTHRVLRAAAWRRRRAPTPRFSRLFQPVPAVMEIGDYPHPDMPAAPPVDDGRQVVVFAGGAWMRVLDREPPQGGPGRIAAPGAEGSQTRTEYRARVAGCVGPVRSRRRESGAR